MKGNVGKLCEKYVKVTNSFSRNEKEEEMRKGVTFRISQYGPNTQDRRKQEDELENKY